MNLNFIFDTKYLQTKGLYIDVILASNIKNMCDKRYIQKQEYSSKFTENSDVKNKFLIFKIIVSTKIRKSRIFIRK